VQCFWWPGQLVVRVRERGIASAQEAASNTPLLAAGFFILVNPVQKFPCFPIPSIPSFPSKILPQSQTALHSKFFFSEEARRF
jgi:hypothetical protein